MGNHTNGLSLELSQYETPFADIAIVKESSLGEGSASIYSDFLREAESPFSRTYEFSSSAKAPAPETEDFVSFLAELNESEFSSSLYEIASEMEDTWQSKISNEAAMGSSYLPFVQQKGREYLSGIIQESESMIDRISEHYSGNNLADYSDAEIDSFFSELEMSNSNYTPAQEQFLGGLIKKVKSVVKTGVNLAKKGISAVSKVLPIGPVLNKIKGLVKPLLEKVLKFAVGKLPQKFQPYARNLAKSFLKMETSENNDDSTASEVEALQYEFDANVAQLVFSHGESEAESLVMEYEMSFENVQRSNGYEDGQLNLPPLHAARDQFINELKNLQPGESPAPAIEKFLPAAILALQPVIKIAISIIGRQKVINFLAGLLAKLVARYVPADVAQPLAASIIDVGMSAIGFETYERGRSELAYEAIANTIQDTVQHMNELNDAVINDEEELTMHLLEAFEKAAASNFPPQYIREDLRVTRQAGIWIGMPRGAGKQLYKKFTRVFDITIDPKTADTVKTFRGLPLSNFLKDKYGIDTTKPIAAKVHVYEATAGTRLSSIAKHENLPGLNAKQPRAWVQLHPLTKEASALILKEPSLGKVIEPSSLSNRFAVKSGQRFYYLEINGIRLRIPPVTRVDLKRPGAVKPPSSQESRSADVQGVINFIKSEIRFNYYFSEEDAKTVVEKLNRNDYLGAAISVRNSVRKVLNEMLVKNIATKVKIVHEAIPELYLEHYDDRQEQFAPLADIGASVGKQMISGIVEKMIEKLSEDAYKALVSYFKARAKEFKEEQAKPQDGVTVRVIWSNIPGMTSIRTVINAIRGKLTIGNLTDLAMPSLPAPRIEIVADKKFN